jgi:nucleoside-diphosphate-sugar epimerase
MKKTISILGCGWYGLPLAKQLLAQGFKVKGSTTSQQKLSTLKAAGIDPYLMEVNVNELLCQPDFFHSETLVICIPPKRSTGDQGSFPKKIEKIAIAAGTGKVTKIIFISSTSVYGDLNKSVTESEEPKPQTASGEAMILAENILKSNKNFKTIIIRFAGLIGPDRDPARFFAGKQNLPNGQAPINLIHLEDCIGITQAILEQTTFGYTINASSPDHPTRQSFYASAARKSGLNPPGFIDELTSWKIVATNYIPELIPYNFKISDWSAWLSTDKL